MSANGCEWKMIKKDIEISLSEKEVILGEFDYPVGKGPWNTVILFHGSGPSDRHATVKIGDKIISQNFDILTEKLVKAGFAVFRYDKRGSFFIDKIISDARVVVKYVSSLKEVNNLFFYGWSQGVQVATAMAKEFSKVKGMILHAGIAEGWSSYFSYILEELVVCKLKQLDKDNDGVLQIKDFESFVPAPTSVSFALYLMVLKVLEHGKIGFNKAIDPKVTGKFSIEEDWIPLAKAIVRDPTLLKEFTTEAPSEIWYGILEDIKEISVPMLVIQGECDGWVSPRDSNKIAKAGGKLAELCVISGFGHSLSPTMSPLDDVGGIIDDKPLEKMQQWLLKISEKAI